MIDLSNERIEKILHEETAKTEELTTILRSIYTRYMRLYEAYFADINALDDEKIAKLKKYNEVTKSLVKYYYMDIPHDISVGLKEFEKEFNAKLLGAGWREYISGNYKEFRDKNFFREKSEEDIKAEFTEQALNTFYDAMDYIFRGGFGTESQTAKETIDGLSGLLFGA